MSTYFLCGHDPRWDHRQIQDGITARLPTFIGLDGEPKPDALVVVDEVRLDHAHGTGRFRVFWCT
jgi:hypothetical protein